jgi:hypothetical protein
VLRLGANRGRGRMTAEQRSPRSRYVFECEIFRLTMAEEEGESKALAKEQ